MHTENSDAQQRSSWYLPAVSPSSSSSTSLAKHCTDACTQVPYSINSSWSTCQHVLCTTKMLHTALKHLLRTLPDRYLHIFVFSCRQLLVVLPSLGTECNSLASVIVPYHTHVTIRIHDSLQKINATLFPEIQSTRDILFLRNKGSSMALAFRKSFKEQEKRTSHQIYLRLLYGYG